MEKKNTGLIVLVVILCLLVGGLGGYIICDKVINKDNDIDNNVVKDIRINTEKDYVYDADYVNDITNTDWVAKSYTFTLTGEQKVCLVVMNPKSPGKDLLIDDASLKLKMEAL